MKYTRKRFSVSMGGHSNFDDIFPERRGGTSDPECPHASVEDEEPGASWRCLDCGVLLDAPPPPAPEEEVDHA